MVTLAEGYHGTTLGALAAAGAAFRRHGAGPLPAGFEPVAAAPAVDPSRPSTMRDLIPSPERIADRICALGPEQIAAVLLEPVLSIGGVLPLPPGYLRQIRGICDEYGALLILDEIATGFARTGAMFAFEHDGVVPDLVTTGKHLTGGYLPLAAVTTTQAVYEAFADDPLLGGLRHGHTTSGHATACAAALAVLGVICDQGLDARAADLGAALLSGLEELRRHAVVRDVRGRGLMAGVELPDPGTAARVAARCADAGVLVRVTGRVVAITPPLTITADQVAQICAAMDTACTLNTAEAPA
mgnify:CR=1 FL=1